jgi:hypothetical protein
MSVTWEVYFRLWQYRLGFWPGGPRAEQCDHQNRMPLGDYWVKMPPTQRETNGLPGYAPGSP